MDSYSVLPDSGIEKLEIRRLFNRFDYSLSFLSSKKILILNAPNGFGKTVILRIIHNFTSGNFRFFTDLVFDEMQFHYLDGVKIRVTNLKNYDPVEDNNTTNERRLKIEQISEMPENYKPFYYYAQDSRELYRYLERNLPVHQLDNDRWVDNKTNEILPVDEILRVYGDSLPRSLAKPSDIPKWLDAVLERTHSHLIETQRLLSFTLNCASSFSRRARRLRSNSVVERNATDLANEIGGVVAQYAMEAQMLDQSFLRRMMGLRAKKVAGEDEVRERLRTLVDRRSELIQAGLIGGEEGAQLSQTDNLTDAETRRILSIYIDDTEKKLKVFEDLHSKVKLFKDILNEHFQFKRIDVNHENGVSAFDATSNEPIRLSELSSGEQQELVLIYELLFAVKEGSIILIDEPELSLHVNWQRRFVSDLMRVQELRDLQFVIATHSPQIISDHWEIVQDLVNEE